MVKQIAIILTTFFLVYNFAIAKDKIANFSKIKTKKLSKLQRKKGLLEKRITCIQKTHTFKEIKNCEKKYPLINRKRTNLTKN